MIGYQTRQRKMLIAFFESHAGSAYTADEVTSALHEQRGEAVPSRSTIYRTIAYLEAENVLKRRYLSDRRKYAYQYQDASACNSHLHMRCEKCNALIHLEPDVSEAIASLLRDEAGASLDVGETVLAGKCSNCSKK
ncbi:MAG: transcriptional repressor [Clostridia bacterium]|nr:transcriptional repressor [Clostridia bacterium]